MDIPSIEERLKLGQVTPGEIAYMKDYLSGVSSQYMDRELQLKMMFADFFVLKKPELGSDKHVQMAWNATEHGKEELVLKNKQAKIKVLLSALGSHLKVFSDQARNMY